MRRGAAGASVSAKAEKGASLRSPSRRGGRRGGPREAPGQNDERRHDDASAEAMHQMNRRQGGKRQEAAVAAAAQGPLQHEGGREVHVRPPRTLAGREIAAGEDRVVGTDRKSTR